MKRLIPKSRVTKAMFPDEAYVATVFGRDNSAGGYYVQTEISRDDIFNLIGEVFERPIILTDTPEEGYTQIVPVREANIQKIIIQPIIK